MERDTVFMNWKTHYDQDVNSSQVDLHYLWIQCNQNQNLSGLFFEIDKLIFKTFYKEANELKYHNLEKEQS